MIETNISTTSELVQDNSSIEYVSPETNNCSLRLRIVSSYSTSTPSTTVSTASQALIRKTQEKTGSGLPLRCFARSTA